MAKADLLFADRHGDQLPLGCIELYVADLYCPIVFAPRDTELDKNLPSGRRIVEVDLKDEHWPAGFDKTEWRAYRTEFVV